MFMLRHTVCLGEIYKKTYIVQPCNTCIFPHISSNYVVCSRKHNAFWAMNSKVHGVSPAYLILMDYNGHSLLLSSPTSHLHIPPCSQTDNKGTYQLTFLEK